VKFGGLCDNPPAAKTKKSRSAILAVKPPGGGESPCHFDTRQSGSRRGGGCLFGSGYSLEIVKTQPPWIGLLHSAEYPSLTRIPVSEKWTIMSIFTKMVIS